ncbi:MAG: DUF2490 domain-containing protein [Legionellales bacterium]|nr:DUF2490 domain-containing protein [Legionellales bacterium]
MKKQFFLFLVLMLPLVLFANSTKQVYGAWWNVDINHNVDNWEYSLQMEARTLFNSAPFRRAVLRPMIGYKIKPNVSIWLGYTSEPSINANNEFFYSHNILEELRSKFFFKYLTLRLRSEQRFLDTGNNMAQRLRTRLQVTLPLSKNRLEFIGSDELFFNLNHPSWVANRTLSENRAILGIQHRISKITKMRFSYMNLLSLGNTRNTMNHIFIVSFLMKV